jgi:hypothetical protein
MISGVNRVYEHGGKEYHLQAEDLGLEQANFVVRVYEGGCVRWQKHVPYSEVVEKNLSKIEQDEAVRALMEKAIHTLQAAIAKGKLSL